MKTKTFKNIQVTGSLSVEGKHEIASIFASWYLENKYKKQNIERKASEKTNLQRTVVGAFKEPSCGRRN